MKAPSPYLGEFEQLVLLAILQCGDDAYTVPIRATLISRSRRRVARGALYTSLDRLEAKGLVRSRLGDPLAVRGGRARRYFTVTASGLEALRGARATLANLSSGLESLLERR
ncbi:MAG TPA: helix-turn-helix transcriptional regulator [Vicinamibacterales bacterium]|nr:helix-turn-helix transcriptional regulator [Vicinamibacterales bacterium]